MTENTVYFLSTKYGGYDSYDSAVIIASNEEKARELAKENMNGDEQRDYIKKVYLSDLNQNGIDDYKTISEAYYTYREDHLDVNVWTDKNASKCKEIGKSELDSQVVISSYNAG